MSLEKSTIQKIGNNKYYLRESVGNAIIQLAKEDERICFVSANVMGSCRVTDSVKLFPERSFNVGICEQEMISFSAGLASEGLIPFAFTMAPFMSLRSCEQVRTDVAYNRLPVRMVAPYSGVSSGISGVTHWAIEDCAVMRGIPGITILEPSCPIQAKKMIEKSLEYEGPIYFRIGIEPIWEMYDEASEYEIGRAEVLCDGDDGAFICSGVLVKYALMAASEFEKKRGIHIRVIDMNTIKPADDDAIIEAAKTGNIVVAQDHNIVGGLGDEVASVLARAGCSVNIKVLGIPDSFVVMAHAPFLYHKYKMDDIGMYEAMSDLLAKD